MKDLYVFLDESGNFDFTNKGTKYFVVCAYVSDNPINLHREMQILKYSLLSSGYEQECYHATEDKQIVRNEVYNIISNSVGKYYYAFSKKSELQKEFQNKKHLYSLLVKELLKNILASETVFRNKYNQIIVILDKILTKDEKGHIRGVLRTQLKSFNSIFHIYFFQTKSDFNAQIADYGSWAKYVSLEREEFRPLLKIKHLIEFDIQITNRHI